MSRGEKRALGVETELARQALEKAMDLTRQWGDRYPWVHLYRNLAQVLVEQGEPTLVLGHEREAGAGDHVVDAEFEEVKDGK